MTGLFANMREQQNSLVFKAGSSCGQRGSQALTPSQVVKSPISLWMPTQRGTCSLQWLLCDFRTSVLTNTVWQGGHAWTCHIHNEGLKLSFRSKVQGYLRNEINWE